MTGTRTARVIIKRMPENTDKWLPFFTQVLIGYNAHDAVKNPRNIAEAASRRSLRVFAFFGFKMVRQSPVRVRNIIPLSFQVKAGTLNVGRCRGIYQ